MRDYSSQNLCEKNSMQKWYKAKNPLRIFLNFTTIWLCKYIPSLRLKNMLYRLIGAKIGKKVSIGMCAVIDVFFPELVEIGDNSLIGYNATILSHEFLVKEFRKGKTKIGKNCMIGANATIVCGVTIGDNSVVSAAAFVNKNVPKNSYARGNPVKIIKKKTKK